MSSSSTIPYQLPAAVQASAEVQPSQLILTAFNDAELMSKALGDKSEEGRRMRLSLVRPSKRGSSVPGIGTIEQARGLLSASKNWVEMTVITGEEERATRIFQGTLPDHCEGFTAYATVAMLFSLFGPEGTRSITVNKGRQDPTEFFLSVPFKVPTRIITVSLTEHEGAVSFNGWWAGPDMRALVAPRADSVAHSVVRCDNPPRCH